MYTFTPGSKVPDPKRCDQAIIGKNGKGISSTCPIFHPDREQTLIYYYQRLLWIGIVSCKGQLQDIGHGHTFEETCDCEIPSMCANLVRSVEAATTCISGFKETCFEGKHGPTCCEVKLNMVLVNKALVQFISGCTERVAMEKRHRHRLNAVYLLARMRFKIPEPFTSISELEDITGVKGCGTSMIGGMGQVELETPMSHITIKSDTTTRRQWCVTGLWEFILCDDVMDKSHIPPSKNRTINTSRLRVIFNRCPTGRWNKSVNTLYCPYWTIVPPTMLGFNIQIMPRKTWEVYKPTLETTTETLQRKDNKHGWYFGIHPSRKQSYIFTVRRVEEYSGLEPFTSS